MKNILNTIFLLLVSILKSQSVSDSIYASPNPFSQRTLVSYTLASNDTISIRVYNISGMLVVLLVNDSIVTAGAHEDSLRMDNFPDGIYIVSLFNRKKNLKNTKIVKSLGTAIYQQNPNKLDLSVYPNPSPGVYNFAFDAGTSIDLGYQIFDVTGQEVKSGAYLSSTGKSTFKVNLDDLRDGVYTLSIFDRTDLIYRQKVIKN